MNKMNQFWALLKFQFLSNPFVLIVPVVWGMPFFITGAINSDAYHPNLSSSLTEQNLFFTGLLALWILAPEMQSWGRTTAWSSGTEFLLTRALDRPVLYRARVALVYALLLLMPAMNIGYSLKHPEVKVTEYSKPAQQECLTSISGSSLELDRNHSPVILLQGGNVLFAQWHLWLFLISALFAQVLIQTIYSFKYRLVIFYVIFMSFIFVPLFLDIAGIHAKIPGNPTSFIPYTEKLFFSFAAHAPTFWFLTVTFLILGHLWCERRFCRQEQ